MEHALRHDRKMEMQTSDSDRDATLLVLNRAGCVLVQTADGYDFFRMSTDLTDAVVFDVDGAKDAITRIQSNLPESGPYTTQSVRDFKMAIVDSFAPVEEIAQKQNESLPSMRM